MTIKYVGGKIKRVYSHPFTPQKKVKEKRKIEPQIKVNVWKKLYQILLSKAKEMMQ